MGGYEKKIDIRWSDLDPNYHVRHSSYYDFGAFCRISFLNDAGLTPAVMLEHHIGPILFREECVFKREIRFGDEILINVKLEKALPDMSRWTMVHELWKTSGKAAALITVDGAWIDTSVRKLAIPPEFFKAAFDGLPRTSRFEWMQRK